MTYTEGSNDFPSAFMCGGKWNLLWEAKKKAVQHILPCPVRLGIACRKAQHHLFWEIKLAQKVTATSRGRTKEKKRAEVQELDVKVVGVLSVVPVNGKIKWEGKGREGWRQIEK